MLQSVALNTPKQSIADSLGPFSLFSPRFVVLFTDDLGHISQWSSIMAGSLAGMVSTIVTYPTDLIKTRLIVQNMLEPSYRGILHAFSTIYQQEGFLALYRGVSLTVLGKTELVTLSKKRLCSWIYTDDFYIFVGNQ